MISLEYYNVSLWEYIRLMITVEISSKYISKDGAVCQEAKENNLVTFVTDCLMFPIREY